MPPEVIFVFIIILFGMAGTILIGQRMQYRHRERLEAGGDPEALGELRAAVERLQAEVAALQEGAADFDERLDFTERLLARPPDESDVGAGSGT